MSPVSTRTDYAILGRTGLKVSRVALGALDRLDQPAFERAAELGINFFISYSGYPREQVDIGRAIHYAPRQRMVLAAGSAAESPRLSLRGDIGQSLSNLATDYLDIYYLFHVTCDTWPVICGAGGAMSELEDARRAGRVRFIGVTVHNRSLAEQIIHSGRVDVVNLRYSIVHPGHEERVFPAAVENACGVVAYSALRHGTVLTRRDEITGQCKMHGARECYRFVLGHPAVHSVWVGARRMEEVESAADVIRPFVRLHPASQRSLRLFGRRLHALIEKDPGTAPPGQPLGKPGTATSKGADRPNTPGQPSQDST